ncbi:hypothetical protein C9439_02850 [archaeon SCG-AAA382B04]|nr:hypothetical protein C9439_02850 [archaeon SCG-AAA382B04]
MGSKRGKWRIFFDIMDVLVKEEEIKRTRLMQRSTLDWNSFKKYFDFLLENDLVVTKDGTENVYKLSEEGKNVYQNLREVKKVFEVK